jgi:predicted dehydrogenase
LTRKVNVGVLGYGFVESNFHLPCYKEIVEANVVAVGGPKKKATEEFARVWRIKKAYSGEDFVEKLCEDREIDAVDIGLPNFLHQKAAVSAAENGKHIVCEKPLGRNSREAETMLSAAKKAGVIHCYAENHIFIPQVAAAKDMIDRGMIGNVFWVRSREAHFGPHSAWFWDPDLAGGGVLIDMGCHSTATSLYIIGRKPKEALAWNAISVHKTKVEDNSVVLIRHSGNELSELENSWSAHGGIDIRFEIYGSDGTIFIDPTRQTGIRVFSVAAEEKAGYMAEKTETKRGWMYPICREHEAFGYLFELEHFLSCISEGRTPRVTFEDGYTVNRIIDACYKSIQSRKWEPIL